MKPEEMDLLTSKMVSFNLRPDRWVLYSFQWGEGELADCKGPEPWQMEILKALADGLLTIDQAIMLAVASGHGIGKSALVSWIILWALSTKVDTKGVVTANTENQLKTKTWAELSKWYRLFIGRDLFKYTATAIFSADPNHEKTWRVDMVAWSENNTEAFAGLHNKGKRILLVFDEASAIADPIWEVSEGALTDKDTQIIWCAFGNPTRNTGRFRECFRKFRHRWITKQIDSRTVSITNLAQINKWIEDYGIDSDFVKVRVLGIFPDASDMQFIPTSYVDAAWGRHLRKEEYDFAPVIIGVDPAWSGGDEIAIWLRQGNMSKQLGAYRDVKDDMQIAGYVAKFEEEYRADAVFVDLGWGTGIVSAGKHMGREWQLIPFGGASSDPGLLNKRTEMWDKMKKWLKDGGSIPMDTVLRDDLIAPEYYVVMSGKNTGKTNLESKEDMKKRGQPSPNRGDALALTFALPVQKKVVLPYPVQKKEYDPYAGV